MSWDYSSPLDNEEMEDLPEVFVWKRLRAQRDYELMSSDFRVLPDSPYDVSAWATYRQLLRDLPEKTSDPRLTEWPEAPQ